MQDAAAKNKESLDASQKIQELGKKIETAREQVKKLPGIDFTKEEQAAQLKALRKQLVLKEVKLIEVKKWILTGAFSGADTKIQKSWW